MLGWLLFTFSLSLNNPDPVPFPHHNISIFLIYLTPKFLKPLELWCQTGSRSPITGV